MGGSRDYFKLGEWNSLCDQCGAKRKSSELRLQWDGLRTCHLCWEPRQPQDFARGVPDPSGVPWSRQRGELAFANMATRPDGSTPPVTPIPDNDDGPDPEV
jgi:hypothetical protein